VLWKTLPNLEAVQIEYNCCNDIMTRYKLGTELKKARERERERERISFKHSIFPA
jgi:hypothetical protein